MRLVDHVPHAQVIAVVLVVHHVAAAQSSLRQTVGEFALVLAQLVPPRHLVPDHFQIGKLLGLPDKSVSIRLTCRALCLLCRHAVLTEVGTGRRTTEQESSEQEKRKDSGKKGTRDVGIVVHVVSVRGGKIDNLAGYPCPAG